MIMRYKYGDKATFRQPSIDGDTVFFNGWAISKEGDKYFVTYISAGHGGKEKKFEISKNDYDDAKNEKIDLQALHRKRS